MMQQSSQNQLPPAAPDETGYYMPNETAGQADSWVYGEPGPNGDQDGGQSVMQAGTQTMPAQTRRETSLLRQHGVMSIMI